ncbi:MAG: creatininase family protein, partial [Oligoflexia bacterium]|nr:creatininase family protein [Oligoflexia bacterium]
MPFDFAAISSDQLRSLPRSRTVFFFPVGPLEDHGPHLPMGLDLYEARRLCELAAERTEKELPGWTAVLMPPAPLGLEGNTTSLVLSVRGHVLRDWLVDACSALIRQGFLHFACFSGHLGPRQLTAIEDAGKIIRRKAGLRRYARSGRAVPS